MSQRGERSGRSQERAWPFPRMKKKISDLLANNLIKGRQINDADGGIPRCLGEQGIFCKGNERRS